MQLLKGLCVNLMIVSDDGDFLMASCDQLMIAVITITFYHPKQTARRNRREWEENDPLNGRG